MTEWRRMNARISWTKCSGWLAFGMVGSAIGLTMAVAGPDTRSAHKPISALSESLSVSPCLRGEKVGSPPPGVDGWVASAERAVAANPRDADALRSLAVAFMRKQRQCGDPDYYRRALAAIEGSMSLEPNSYESRKLKAWVLAGQHRFVEARDLARQCIAERPRDAWNYGTLADAQTELGNYPAAVAAVQQMIDLKPGLASYTRAAHQRDLHGDPAGALQLFDLALDTTSRRDLEAIAWVRAQRGTARLGMESVKSADAEFQQALELQPGYHLALAGRARCQALLGNRREAIRWYEKALAVIPRPDWAIALGEVKQAAGDSVGAKASYTLAQAAMATAGASADVDRLVASFLADHGDPKAALEHARRAARERDDIYTCDTLAWALYSNGRFAEAWTAAQRAMRLKTRDAGILYHAGLIAQRLPGHTAAARRLLRQAVAINPTLNPSQAPKAPATLAARSQG
jgi:tetratricopeptide (TPR) repeat protein